MTLDEAIKHCLEVAEENDLAAGTYELLAENNHNAYERLTAETNSSRCAECATDHRQLAEWLTELKKFREVYGVCPAYEESVKQIPNFDANEMDSVKMSKHLRWDNHKDHWELLKEFYYLNKYLITEQLKDALLDAMECMEYTMIEEGESYKGEGKKYHMPRDGEQND